MKWKHPHIIKIYEALGTIANNRLEISGNVGKVFSSNRNKFYEIQYDPGTQSIMSNDNASYWVGSLGYPAIAFLMKIGALLFDSQLASLLKGIEWKNINQKFKNDFDKSLEYVLSSKSEEERNGLKKFAEKVDKEIKKLNLNLLGKKKFPPRD